MYIHTYIYIYIYICGACNATGSNMYKVWFMSDTYFRFYTIQKDSPPAMSDPS